MRLAGFLSCNIGGGIVKNPTTLAGIFEKRLHEPEFVVETRRRQINTAFQDPFFAMDRADIAQGHAVEKGFDSLDVLGLAFGSAGRERVVLYFQPVAGERAETGVGPIADDEIAGP